MFVAWATGPLGAARARMAVRAGGRWTTRELLPGPGAEQRVVAAGPRQGRATVLVQIGPSLVALYD